jgi:hypothetical protein
VDFGACVLFAEDGTLFTAGARGRLMGRKKSLGNVVVVGDLVRLEAGADGVVVDQVRPRRNVFSRRAAGDQAVEQVVATNLDQVVLVTSLAQPEFTPGLADRVLAQAEHAGIPARLVLNKTDLGSPEQARALVRDYERAGVPCHAVCAPRGEGVEGLRHALHGRRSLFVGHSGVGKSTLLNALVPALDLLVGLECAPSACGAWARATSSRPTSSSGASWASAASATAGTSPSPAARCARRSRRARSRACASSRSSTCARSWRPRSSTARRGRDAGGCRRRDGGQGRIVTGRALC